MVINVRDKGQRAERAAVALLQPIVTEIFERYGYAEIPELKRNLQQTQKGGYDISGLEWMALEIKHQEKLSCEEWWKQTLRQCGKMQEPILMYKQNNVKWRVRMRAYLPVYTELLAMQIMEMGFNENGANHRPLRMPAVVDIDIATFLDWFRYRLEWQLSIGVAK